MSANTFLGRLRSYREATGPIQLEASPDLAEPLSRK